MEYQKNFSLYDAYDFLHANGLGQESVSLPEIRPFKNRKPSFAVISERAIITNFKYEFTYEKNTVYRKSNNCHVKTT